MKREDLSKDISILLKLWKKLEHLKLVVRDIRVG